MIPIKATTRTKKLSFALWLALPLIIAIILVLAGGCQSNVKDDRALIVTSIYPYQILVQELVGDSIQVKSIIPANASPHTWSAKPADLKALSQAQLLIMNGMGLEGELTQAFGQDPSKLIDVSRLINLPAQNKAPEHQGDHAHGDSDPHIWLSPRLLIRITLLLADQLQTRFPAHAKTISQNTMRLVADLSALHQQIAAERASFTDPAIITYHDSFHWFCADYDISMAGSVQSSPGKEPTPKQLSQLGAAIKAHKIRAIFVEPQMDRRSAKVLAQEFKLQIIELDPLGHSFKAQRITDLIFNNWSRMKESWQIASP